MPSTRSRRVYYYSLNIELRDKYLDSYPEVFHLPDHYKNYPSICMWINTGNIHLIKEILELSWKELATEKQVREWEEVKE